VQVLAIALTSVRTNDERVAQSMAKAVEAKLDAVTEQCVKRAELRVEEIGAQASSEVENISKAGSILAERIRARAKEEADSMREEASALFPSCSLLTEHEMLDTNCLTQVMKLQAVEEMPRWSGTDSVEPALLEE